jgi:aspartate/methionine/tyrosine aminotransferase
VLSDEAYEDFVYEGAPAVLLNLDGELPESERLVFSFHTFSKSFSLTGYRLGYVSAPNRERANLLQRVQEAMLVSPSTPVQFAGLAALRDHEHLRRHREYVRATRDEVVRMLTAAQMLERVPNGGWYALVDLSRCPGDSATACQRLLDERAVALAPGHAFASADHTECRRLARVALCRERESTLRGIQMLVDWAKH